jgi:hypothetical protein
MSNQFAKLGTAAVLDADNLTVGSFIEIEKEILVVTKIVDTIHVYFRPATKLEQLRYYWSQFSFWGKTLICGILISLGVIIFYGLRN